MTSDEHDDLLKYCQYAIRLGSSRGFAFKKWRERFNWPSRKRFEKTWRVAQVAERLFTPEGGVRRDIDPG